MESTTNSHFPTLQQYSINQYYLNRQISQKAFISIVASIRKQFNSLILHIMFRSLIQAGLKYFIIEMLLRVQKHLCFSFCNINFHRYLAAERVLQTVLNHDSHIKERPEDFFKNPKNFMRGPQFEFEIAKQKIRKILIENKKKPRTLLCDQIMSALIKMKNRNEISEKVAEEVMDMFNPLKGVQVPKINSPFAKQRFELGVNEDNKFPLNPNSSVMKFFLQKFYQPVKSQKGDTGQIQNSKFKLVNYGVDTIHIIGTPGFGKSSSLYALKLLHDLRIKHILQKLPEDSIFLEHCKFFYFHAKQNNIFARLCDQLIKDFGQIPQEVEAALNKKQLMQFALAVSEVYFRKSIKFIAVVDQVNSLYNMSEKEREILALNWRFVSHASQPIFLVSSKNIPDLSISEDPVKIIATSDKEQYLKQYNMDNYISAESRLLYSVECILFELQKSKVSKKVAVQFIKKLKQIPIMSHLAIRKTVQLLEGQSLLEKLINQNIIDNAFLEQFEKKNSQSFDLANIKKNVQEFDRIANNRKKQKQRQVAFRLLNQQNSYKKLAQKKIDLETLNKSIQILAYILSFCNSQTINKQISVQIQIVTKHYQDQDKQIKGETEIIRHRIQAPARKFNKKIDSSILNLASTNYFYRSRCLVGRPQQTQGQPQQLLFISLSSSLLEEIRNFALQKVTWDFIRKLKIRFPQLAQILEKQTKGLIFENLVCLIFESPQTGENIQITLEQFDSQNFWKLSLIAAPITFKLSLRDGDQLIVDRKKNESKPITESQLPKFFLQQGKCTYVRMAKKNPSFDFLLSKYQNGVLRLLLVDTLLGEMHVQSKNNKFFDSLLKKQNFHKFIQLLSKEDSVTKIQICYYVLKSTEEHCKKLRDKQAREKSANQNNKNSQKKQEKLLTKDQILAKINEFKSNFKKVSIIKAKDGNYRKHFQVIKGDKLENKIQQYCRALHQVNYPYPKQSKKE